MRKIGVLFLLGVFASSIVWAQTEQPLTQAEFVKQLYGIQNSTAKRDALVETIRKRGIDFELTSGLRGLVLSKGGSGDELRRTLEEAARRKANSTAAALPSEKEAADVLAKAKEATLAAVDEMPDFVVKQLIWRSYGYAGTGNWKSQDRLTIAVSYSATKGEEYKVLAIDGNAVNAVEGSNYHGLDGSTTGGEFVNNLAKIFKEDSKTKFKVIDTDVLRSRNSIVYEYEIALENNKNGIGLKDAVYSIIPVGQKGKIWVDRENYRVLRIEQHATEIPKSFPLTSFEEYTDYNWVEINGEKYLLPILADARFTEKGGDNLVQTRNLITFRNYQKYGTEVKILDDDETVDETPAPEPKKPQ